MAEFTKKDKTTIQTIILEHIQAISKKSLVEFKGGFTVTKDHGNWAETIVVADSRKEYVQGIEFLSDLVMPRYDTAMKKSYDAIIKDVNSILKEYDDDKIDYETFIIKKLRLIRKLFQKIQDFFHRTKFFRKEEVFG